MQHLRSGFRVFIILSLASTMIISCKDIPRDNPLDPNNPDSYRGQMILLEAFVNTENDQSYNEYMLSAMETITNRYNGKVIIAQYHRNTISFADSLTIPENETLYDQYVGKFNGVKGVPDVFINGTFYRVKGASSVISATERIDAAVQSLLVKNSFFTIEPKVGRKNSKVTISTKIARLGSESVSDIIVSAIVTEQIDDGINTSVVRHLENANLIPRLQPGEQREINFSEVPVNSEANLNIIFTIKSYQDMAVHQSIEVVVP